MPPPTKNEIEVKIEVADAESVAARLEALGATLHAPRTFEDNRLFDLAGGALARSGGLLRLRVTGPRAILTGKGPATRNTPAGYKVRAEEEVEVSDPDGVVRALEAAGFRTAWRYQKYRREYRLGGAHILIDEIPHGVFVEIEGEPDAIDAVATRLGFDRSAYLTSTYREIHERRAGGREDVGDMVFEDRDSA